MKKLLGKNIKRSFEFENSEPKASVLASIAYNSNLFQFTRWKASIKLDSYIQPKNSKTAISFRCLKTISKKKFNNISFYSRHVLLKFARSNMISGLKRSVW